MQLYWIHPQRSRERDGSGLIPQVVYGLQSGMQASWGCIILLLMNGKNGSCQVKNLNHTQYLLMTRILCGSVILVRMLWCDLIHHWKNFNPFHYPALRPKCVNF